MPDAMQLPKYSIGVGDRFAQEGEAQLEAFVRAAADGVDITPVWNKSNREHNIVGSDPAETRRAADAAVKKLGWTKPYFCDADHINLQTVERFLQPCDFFTIDVADQIGQGADREQIDSFIDRHNELLGELSVPGLGELFVTKDFVQAAATKYLSAIASAKEIYTAIENKKGAGNFVPEISMDETDEPQTPPELLIILAAIADANIPIQTIAPKFTGRFNKGVDYVGNVHQFEKEFRDDIAVLGHAVKQYGLPENLKLSVHSGSDKFSLYPVIREALKQTGAGLHLKTAGTTWLEEIIGLAEGGGNGLELAKEIYREALDHREELCAPYAAVIDIAATQLPRDEEVQTWSGEQFVAALRHNPNNPAYNKNMRQLLHVGFKIAAKQGERYLNMLREHRESVARNVTVNLYDRHIAPLFLNDF